MKNEHDNTRPFNNLNSIEFCPYVLRSRVYNTYPLLIRRVLNRSRLRKLTVYAIEFNRVKDESLSNIKVDNLYNFNIFIKVMCINNNDL